jgi:hypothetical protein
MNPHRPEPLLTVGNCIVAAMPLLATVAFALLLDTLTAEVALSFVVLGLAMSLHALQAIRGRANSAADASVFVFGLMFLLVAPIVQLSVLGYKLVNTTHAQPDLLVETNLACSLFIAVYLLARVTILPPPAATPYVRDLAPPLRGLSTFSLAAFVAMSFFIALVSIPFLGVRGADSSVTPVLLAFRKFVFFIPTALFLIALADMTSSTLRRSFLHVLLMVLLFGCVLVTQNPLSEKRNGLGPVYLAVIFLMFRGGFQRKGVQVAWLVGILLVAFPLVAIVTTIPWQYLDQLKWEWTYFSDHFLTTHYDAWANIYTTVEMVGRNGMSAGKQLAGALLFYVPSTWWSGKPLATGIEIGNFLINFYTMWFNNLSAPLIAEGFLDFGYLGVAAYAVALAALVRAIERWSAPGRSALVQAVAAYLAFFIVFLLRGSLMIAFAYGSGALTAFVVSRALIALFAGGPARRSRRLATAQATAQAAA